MPRARSSGSSDSQASSRMCAPLSGTSVPRKEYINGDVGIFTFLANGYFDFNNDSKFTPYLTAGLGMANVEIDAGGGGSS